MHPPRCDCFNPTSWCRSTSVERGDSPRRGDQRHVATRGDQRPSDEQRREAINVRREEAINVPKDSRLPDSSEPHSQLPIYRHAVDVDYPSSSVVASESLGIPFAVNYVSWPDASSYNQKNTYIDASSSHRQSKVRKTGPGTIRKRLSCNGGGGNHGAGSLRRLRIV